MYESDSLRLSACILHSLPDAQLDTRAALNAHVGVGCVTVCARVVPTVFLWHSGRTAIYKRPTV